MENYINLNYLDFFKIQADCGEAEFMKLSNIHESICITSCNGTYEKGKVYYFQFDQKVIKTNI